MKKESKIYIAGHKGMVGSAIVRKLNDEGFNNLLTRSSQDLWLYIRCRGYAFKYSY